MASEATRYRKRSGGVQAVRHDGNIEETFERIRALGWMEFTGFAGLKDGGIEISSWGGSVKAEAGDYIVLDSSLGSWPVPLKPSAFNAMYEEAQGAS